MTRLGEYLTSRSVNQSEISRKTGLSKSRINQLSNNNKTRLGAQELFLIILAVEADPCEGFKFINQDTKLKQ